ncbi:ribosome biogenesis GTPase YqeH [Lactobacillus sp.] [Lactiplantibacillus mudanjiangensis]|nr:ribosome biogenesis GTPase YqeH [Lactobacillus sp.] [Lactiplantibacillus mudanjiangensis]
MFFFFFKQKTAYEIPLRLVGSEMCIRDSIDTVKPAGVVYVDNNLTLHRTKTENAENFYEKHVGELITPPTGDAVADFPPLVRHEFKTTAVSDVVFEGLGWVTVPADTRVAGWAPQGVDVLTRPAMINRQ